MTTESKAPTQVEILTMHATLNEIRESIIEASGTMEGLLDEFMEERKHEQNLGEVGNHRED